MRGITQNSEHPSGWRVNGIVAQAAIMVLMVIGAVTLGGCYNFHAVSEGRVYRAAQPMEEDLSAMIKSHGIRTVLRLNGSREGQFWYDEGVRAAETTGATFIQVGMSANRFPTRDELVNVWAVLDGAEYPLLVHCREGADRTGLVSAMSVLHDGGSMADARDQLKFLPYGHASMFGTESMGRVLDMYEPWFGVLSFGDWAATVYEQPVKGTTSDVLVPVQREKVAAYRASGKQ